MMKYLLALALTGLSLPSAAQVLAIKDAPGKTASGVRFTQPQNWTLQARGPVTVFAAPEGDLRVAVVDVGRAKDASQATARAWSLYKPAVTPKVRLITAEAALEGWDSRASIAYETSPSEHSVRASRAFARGDAWTVMIVDGSEATFDKRSAAAAVIQSSLRPAGYTRESFAGKSAYRLTPARVQLLRDFVEQSARELDVPGVGLALIDHGQVVWQGGIGVRRIGSSVPVDAHTKFMIASNTKGMTTLLLSILADEGKLGWDQKVIDLYPTFRLGNDATTKAVLVRNLVCACTGLPRKDFAFILADQGAPASDTFRQLSQTQPTSRFGELFQYNNLMASAAGYLGGALTYPKMEIGAAYDRVMQEKIFDPLQMHDTTFDFKVGTSGDWAPPHGYDVNGRVVEMSNYFNYTIYPYRPAGGAFSSAADMARYVQLELTRGLMPKGRLVSEANLLKRREPGVAVGEDTTYGMGLFNRVAWGVPVISHGGTLLGYHSNWYALPDQQIGAVVLTNADPGAAMLDPFLRRLLEVLFDGRPEAAKEVATAAARLKAQALVRKARLTIPGDPAVLAGLAAAYHSSDGGSITIADRAKVMWAKAGSIEAPIATRRNSDGSTSIVSIGPGVIDLDALVGVDAKKRRTLTVQDSQHQYIYTELNE